MPNYYNDLTIDISQKHQEINDDPMIKSNLSHCHGWLIGNLNKFLFFIGWYQKLVDSGFYRGWFEEFEDYWQHALGGRPLRLHDFYFLHSWYRIGFQNVSVNDEGNAGTFLYAWQNHLNIYSVFSAVYKYALSPFQYFPFRKYLHKHDSVLEYGCGAAPIVSSLINDKKINFKFTIADIPQFTYHYAKWRLKQFGVKCVDCIPNSLPKLEDTFNIIFLITVLEHLPDPLAVVQHLTRHLEEGGYLCFDFILSKGDGLDTSQALRERGQVLKFIRDNYEIVEGKIILEESMGRTIARKK
ncbi:MAG: methyltransferase domain-containing protein [Candidatus Magasanikbacteria bacterium]